MSSKTRPWRRISAIIFITGYTTVFTAARRIDFTYLLEVKSNIGTRPRGYGSGSRALSSSPRREVGELRPERRSWALCGPVRAQGAS